MGFFETLGNIIVKAEQKAGEFNQGVRGQSENYQRYDDETLMRISKSSNFTNRMAAANILKERGYILENGQWH